MSYEMRFSFSNGLSRPLTVPRGTKDKLLATLVETERRLKIPRETYCGHMRWDHFGMDTGLGGRNDLAIPDEELCSAVIDHNRHVNWLWDRLRDWNRGDQDAPGYWEGTDQKNVGYTEVITPEDADEFWFGLGELSVRPERWTEAYYRHEMDRAYDVMRGRSRDGVTFNAKKHLTPEQCDAVVKLFASWLDTHDCRIAVPKGRDYLAASSDGGYQWCDKCYRAIANGDEYICQKTGCPVRDEED